MSTIVVNTFLEHHGVKGMRWGVRKQSSSGGPKQSRRQRRQAEHKARIAEGKKRAAAILDHAAKHPDDLILLNGHTVVTGKEFVDHLALGGLLNVKTSGVYAVRTKHGYARATS